MGNPTGRAAPSNSRNPRLAISLGDPAGIGAEVVLKALARPWPAHLEPVLVGCRRWLEESYQALRAHSDAPLRDPAELEVRDLPLSRPVPSGVSRPEAGAASFAWLSAATALVQSGDCRALVTAPIAKASWHAAGLAGMGVESRHHQPGGTAEPLAELQQLIQLAAHQRLAQPAGHGGQGDVSGCQQGVQAPVPCW